MNHLTLIGEKINYSIPRIGSMLDARNYGAVREVARRQAERGADYIDVNVGPLPPEVMGGVVRAVRDTVAVPLCIDSTDPAMLEAGIEAHESERSGGSPGPILNSAIEHNAERVLALRARFACQVVLLVSERLEDGVLERNMLPGQAADTARRLFRKAREAGFGAAEIYIDPGTPPVASDMEGLVNTALETIEKVKADRGMEGAHTLVGISNFTAGLPKQVKLPLQSAFLTLAVKRGLDTLIGDPGRGYRILRPGDPHLEWLERILASTGTGRLEALTSYPLYRSAPATDNRDKPAGDRGRGESQ